MCDILEILSRNSLSFIELPFEALDLFTERFDCFHIPWEDS